MYLVLLRCACDDLPLRLFTSVAEAREYADEVSAWYRGDWKTHHPDAGHTVAELLSDAPSIVYTAVVIKMPIGDKYPVGAELTIKIGAEVIGHGSDGLLEVLLDNGSEYWVDPKEVIDA